MKEYDKEMSVINKVKKYIIENDMLKENDSVIVGLSGGADSVCLLDILVKLKEELRVEIIAVHIHHGIRGEEADRDLEFAKNICIERNVEFREFIYDVPAYAKLKKMTEEEAGRELRYSTFYGISESAKIAIAHNMNDNVETFVHNICRGSGITGLIGIRKVNDRIIRPILCLTRQEIEEYLDSNNIKYITDSSNLSDDYTRNKIRLNVIPYLCENINIRTCEHINEVSKDLEETEEYIMTKCKSKYAEIFSKKDSELYVSISEFNQEDVFIRKRLIRLAIEDIAGRLKDISRKHIEDILDLTNKQSGKFLMLPYNIVVRIQHDFLVFSIVNDGNEELWEEIEILKDGTYEFGEYIFEIEILDICNSKENIKIIENLVKNDGKLYTKCFDCDKMNFTACLRQRKSGDYLIINDKGGKKKLKQYFVDEKVPANIRHKVPLLTDGSHIVWIIGYRISEYYKVTKDTKRVMKITGRKKNSDE